MKEEYISPTILVVAFKSEIGFVTSVRVGKDCRDVLKDDTNPSVTDRDNYFPRTY